jgi:hypothetical protein
VIFPETCDLVPDTLPFSVRAPAYWHGVNHPLGAIHIQGETKCGKS